MVAGWSTAQTLVDRYFSVLESNADEVKTLKLPDESSDKDFDNVKRLLDECFHNGLDHTSTLVSLGGDVIGDIVGFAAAIFHRGVSYIHIPVTIPAMIDSSIGGKTGVNHPMGRDSIGAMYQPKCVLIDTAVLKFLPEAELDHGVTELLTNKRNEKDFVEWLERFMGHLLDQDALAMRYAITKACKGKIASLAS